eukprot:TRINITY_DN47_c1_g1_i3.p1 TRINITY_DN47_c1_g1~~TRINITY_DN47_c1_g1_i3.p1  ORF type:complete len:622 (-),score=168.01 TRINITY_DN47_c1_g1_i3:821-2686(-)
MKTIICFIAIIIAVTNAYNITATPSGCFGCTAVVGMMESKLPSHHRQLLRDLENSIGYEKDSIFDKVCGMFPAPLQPKCQSILHAMTFPKTMKVIKMFFRNDYPADICAVVGYCNKAMNDKCVLWKEWPNVPFPDTPPYDPIDIENTNGAPPLPATFHHNSNEMKEHKHMKMFKRKLNENNYENGEDTKGFFGLIEDIFKLDHNPCKGDVKGCDYDNFVKKHEPVTDLDGDNFVGGNGAMDHTFRGRNWRGRDCNDNSTAVYPGSQAALGNDIDQNCNGIFGTEKSTNESYEDKFCKETPPRGLLVIGDSATAHFHLPPALLNPSGIVHAANHMFWKGANELDLPQCSWATGFNPSDRCPTSALPVKSIYERMFERNRCMHRDYANLGVNGARINDSFKFFQTVHRAKEDYPMTVIISMFGNDVCAHVSSHMTTPSYYAYGIKHVLLDMDNKLPEGSHVIFVPPANAKALYESTHGHIHPIGTSYDDIYTYMTCMDFNPCNTWLTTDEKTREASSKRVLEFRKAGTSQTLAMASTLKNIKATYLDYDIVNDVFARFYAKFPDMEPVNLIEPSDGFHPSQLGNAFFAESIWEQIEKEAPDALGEINSHNSEIEKLFGDQGGL